jgi:uncharacterized membrane protein
MKNILITFSVLVLLSCKHEIKNQTQATPEVSFANDIQPIITSNCTMSGCHGSENTSEFTLLSYNDVINNGEIRAKHPAESDLYEKITDTNQDDIMPPPPYQPLSQEQIALIEKWIKEGAKNN